MSEVRELLDQFKYYANNPRKQLDKYLAEGKKAVGIFPYYAPEEIAHAGGLVPFGVWGGQGPIEKAKEYFEPIANTPKEDKYYKYMISDIHAARNFLAKMK